MGEHFSDVSVARNMNMLLQYMESENAGDVGQLLWG